MTDNLDDLVRAVVDARVARDESAEIVNQCKEDLNNSIIGAHLIVAIEKHKKNMQLLDVFENTLKEKALDIYQLNQDKHPHTAFEIKETLDVEIVDKPRLLDWCLQKFVPALILDEKAVEKAAKSGLIPNNLVTVTTVPKVFLSKNIVLPDCSP